MERDKAYRKLRGGYYTPDGIADFLVRWAVRSPDETILEPACGDGRILRAVRKRLLDLGAPQGGQTVTGVELDIAEAEKARQYGFPVVTGDFFAFCGSVIEGGKTYDVIIGNPPYVRYQNVDESCRAAAFALMKRHGFHPNRLMNLWVPFLLLSCEALGRRGRIGMVVPAELMQVGYAAEARAYLASHLDLTVVTFRHLVFPDIQQEVVLLLGETGTGHTGIRMACLDGLDDLEQGLSCLAKAEERPADGSGEKWIRYFLSRDEADLLRRLDGDSRIADMDDLCEVNVGLVSGENRFFLMNESTVRARGLEKDAHPVVSRADELSGIRFTNGDFEMLKEAGRNVYLFLPESRPVCDLDPAARAYIAWGEAQHMQNGYKCRARKHWYSIPSSWTGDAFLTRHANQYPRMVLNAAGTSVTDSLHKVRFHPGVSAEAVTAAYLNTYTLALSETLGRSYGGGVIIFEPGEARRMRIPMSGAGRLDIERIDRLQRDGRIGDILSYTDRVLLRDGLGLDKADIARLHAVWDTLRSRRMSRRKIR